MPKFKAGSIQKIEIVLLNIFLLLCLGLFISAGLPVHAENEMPAPKGSLSLHYMYQSTSLDGVNVRLYKVADLLPNGTFELIAPYKDKNLFPVTGINNISDQNTWNALVTPVSAYIYSNGVKPAGAQTTRSGGLVSFTDLSFGIYLVVADSLSVPSEHCVYSFTSFFTSIPGVDENGRIVSDRLDVVGIPKCEKTTVPDKYSYSVYKRWNDTNYTSVRPTAITIHVYKDGNLYTTQVLNASNNWSYSWTEEPGHTWSVTEETDFTKYSMSIEISGNVFYIINTYLTPPPPPGEVLGESREVKGESRLPQTGQLWWPVPLFLILGCFLLILGVRLDKSSSRKEKL